MKRLLLMLLFVLIGLISRLHPCDISIEAKDIPGKNGKAKLVTVFIEIVHSRCRLDIEKTGFGTTGARIDQKGSWQKVGEDYYRIELQVTLTGNNAQIGVIRDCTKRGPWEKTLKLDQA